MRTGTVKFFNESKVTDSLQTKKQEKTFLFMLQESTRKNYAKETELAMKKKGRKGKVAAKVAVI
jgi:cold shock CspA family protein